MQSSSTGPNICEIDEELKQKIGKFKMRKDKNTAAIVSKYLVLVQAFLTIFLYFDENVLNYFSQNTLNALTGRK